MDNLSPQTHVCIRVFITCNAKIPIKTISLSFMDILVLRNGSCVSEHKAAAAGDVLSALGCGGVAWTKAEDFPKPDISDGSC